MPSAKKKVNTIADKLAKVNENFSISMYDNGYMFEIGGRNKENDYVSAKILCSDIEQVMALVREAADMERDE